MAEMGDALYVRGAEVATADGMLRCDVVIRDGKIVGLPRSEANVLGLPEVDATGLTALPGFIDVHTHGAAGIDVNAADVEGLRTIGRFFASQGVTGWLCSVLTDTPEQTRWCLRQARQVIEEGIPGGAALLGIHLEGPCLACAYKGAMPEHLLMHEADFDLFRRYQEESGGNVRYVTLAPEVPGVEEMIPRLNALGITCAIGHSGAGYDEASACVEAGARAATHLGNAMRLFHQHDPAIFGVALEQDLFVETISDGRHLHSGSVRLYLKSAGWDRVVAVTDSIMAAGLPDGAYKLGVNDVVVEDGDAKLADTGVRAGSTLTMAQALRNIMAFTGVDAGRAAQLLSRNPAELIGFAGKGRIAAGCDGDLVLVDSEQQVACTVVGGRVVYTR
ncbi:N-acetylglucosamine-6-phosphate deacetylase [Collinsella vaginalis]|uniref:N-acetylglucosamine-6-phosphate deacetylase n=1 Tax=Collinsella vaginalis TaxID=1870987 RepID=UPI001FEAC797|nr:N-acetylglucosamine-6-phosphate deacetylase [Collinsella vaginalis]